jgi:hypothetical protein
MGTQSALLRRRRVKGEAIRLRDHHRCHAPTIAARSDIYRCLPINDTDDHYGLPSHTEPPTVDDPHNAVFLLIGEAPMAQWPAA